MNMIIESDFDVNDDHEEVNHDLITEMPNFVIPKRKRRTSFISPIQIQRKRPTDCYNLRQCPPHTPIRRDTKYYKPFLDKSY